MIEITVAMQTMITAARTIHASTKANFTKDTETICLKETGVERTADAILKEREAAFVPAETVASLAQDAAIAGSG